MDALRRSIDLTRVVDRGNSCRARRGEQGKQRVDERQHGAPVEGELGGERVEESKGKGDEQGQGWLSRRVAAAGATAIKRISVGRR